jgi:hypothetical protein
MLGGKMSLAAPSKGLRAKTRLILEFCITFALLYFIKDFKADTLIKLPFNTTLNLGSFYYLLAKKALKWED